MVRLARFATIIIKFYSNYEIFILCLFVKKKWKESLTVDVFLQRRYLELTIVGLISVRPFLVKSYKVQVLIDTHMQTISKISIFFRK